MSYAEPGPNSDVYVWSDGRTLHCEMPGPSNRPRTFTCVHADDMWEHLRSHLRRGDKVPHTALDRLWHEARGLPYETDVEAALRELRDV